MKPPSFSLSIPEPCTENWEQMTLCEKGRFCNSCQKTIVDFTGFSDAELMAFFSGNKTEAVCGRFYVHQIENKVFSYTAPVNKSYRTLAMAASVAALTVLSFSADAQETTRELPVVPPIAVDISAPSLLKSKSDTVVIEGVVKDESGELILSASVQVLSNNQVLGGTATDLDGYYKISPLQLMDADTIKIKCTFLGYETTETTLAAFEVRDTTKVNFTLKRPKMGNTTSRELLGGCRFNRYPNLIDKNNTGSSTTISDSSLDKMPR
ncbi:MAG: carboxypeptidase regulatory-like domain-containing protein [Sphingobacteriales bacterium]|nr:MAG: carboxypeptidase regulatory-like domain-containing protein [Sphingobacteriales bacterium]